MSLEPKKVHTSALCFVPAIDRQEGIQQLRATYDRQIKRWPPHVNLLYPFVPETEFETAAQTLATALRDIEAFSVVAAGFGSFRHGKNTTVWLDPTGGESSVACAQWRALQALCQQAFPHFTDQTSRKPFVPHLTVGQFEESARHAAFEAAVAQAWEPLPLHVGEVVLISRAGADAPFLVHWRVALGTGVATREDPAARGVWLPPHLPPAAAVDSPAATTAGVPPSNDDATVGATVGARTDVERSAARTRIELVDEKAAAARRAAEAALRQATSTRHARFEAKPKQAALQDAHVRAVLRAWRRYAAVSAHDATLALQARVLCSDLSLRSGFESSEIELLQSPPASKGEDEALADRQWEAVLVLVHRAAQQGALSVAQEECLRALRCSSVGSAALSADGGAFEGGAAFEGDGEESPRREYDAALVALQAEEAERFVPVPEYDPPGPEAAPAFRVWVPYNPGRDWLPTPTAHAENPLYRLRVVADPQRADEGGDRTDVPRLIAEVEAWGTHTRRDEVVLTAVAGALVEALRPTEALPLIVRLMRRHHEERESAICEEQLAVGASRGRAAQTLPLRADGRLHELYVDSMLEQTDCAHRRVTAV